MHEFLPTAHMPEAEVSLRLAFALLRRKITGSDVSVAIDGAQVRIGEDVHFRIFDFLHSQGCRAVDAGPEWRSKYSVDGAEFSLHIHSAPGVGDVVTTLYDGRRLRVECKKGPLSRSRSSSEYPLLREALGQVLTVERVETNDLLAVAVPKSKKFEELASRWRVAPLVARAGILILTVGRDDAIDGLG